MAKIVVAAIVALLWSSGLHVGWLFGYGRYGSIFEGVFFTARKPKKITVARAFNNW